MVRPTYVYATRESKQRSRNTGERGVGREEALGQAYERPKFLEHGFAKYIYSAPAIHGLPLLPRNGRFGVIRRIFPRGPGYTVLVRPRI